MQLTTRLKPSVIRTRNWDTITENYMGIGNAYEHPQIHVRFENHTNAPLYVSYNGITDHFLVSQWSFIAFDFCWNKSNDDDSTISGAFFEDRRRLYVRAVDAAHKPTRGDFDVIAFYGVTNDN